MRTRQELAVLQKLPLELKILKTQARIREWIAFFGKDNVYVSFSGGKDSTVLLDLVRKIEPTIPAVFVDTGLEYPEIRQFVKTFDNVTILRPKMRFDEVIREYGYPLISKGVSECVSQGRIALKKGIEADDFIAYTELVVMNKFKEIPLRNDIPYPYRLQKLLGVAKDKNGDKSKFNKERYKPLLFVDFKISNMCCNVMKKAPAHAYTKSSGRFPMTAQTAEESMLRTQQWLKNGCNGFDMKSPISNPMSFWTEQDILQYIKRTGLRIAPVYGEIAYERAENERYTEPLCDVECNLCTTGAKRTGCIFCMFGASRKGDDRFLRLKQKHPRQYEYCMGGGAYDDDGFWKPNKDGLGMKHVIDETNKIYGKGFIKY